MIKWVKLHQQQKPCLFKKELKKTKIMEREMVSEDFVIDRKFIGRRSSFSRKRRRVSEILMTLLLLMES